MASVKIVGQIVNRSQSNCYCVVTMKVPTTGARKKLSIQSPIAYPGIGLLKGINNIDYHQLSKCLNINTRGPWGLETLT